MDKPIVGLVLAGGGARAAYQVGVLMAVAHMLPRDQYAHQDHRWHERYRTIS